MDRYSLVVCVFAEDAGQNSGPLHAGDNPLQPHGAGLFEQAEPKRFKDTYAVELRELVNKKAKGQKIEIPKTERVPASNVVNLMDALKKSLGKEKAAKPAGSAKRRSAK